MSPRRRTRDQRRFVRDVRRTIVALPDDEDTLLRVEAALHATPGYAPAAALWRLFRPRPAALDAENSQHTERTEHN